MRAENNKEENYPELKFHGFDEDNDDRIFFIKVDFLSKTHLWRGDRSADPPALGLQAAGTCLDLGLLVAGSHFLFSLRGVLSSARFSTSFLVFPTVEVTAISSHSRFTSSWIGKTLL